MGKSISPSAANRAANAANRAASAANNAANAIVAYIGQYRNGNVVIRGYEHEKVIHTQFGSSVVKSNTVELKYAQVFAIASKKFDFGAFVGTKKADAYSTLQQQSAAAKIRGSDYIDDNLGAEAVNLALKDIRLNVASHIIPAGKEYKTPDYEYEVRDFDRTVYDIQVYAPKAIIEAFPIVATTEEINLEDWG